MIRPIVGVRLPEASLLLVSEAETDKVQAAWRLPTKKMTLPRRQHRCRALASRAMSERSISSADKTGQGQGAKLGEAGARH